MSDLKLLECRLQEIKELADRLAYMHKVMLAALRDISRQSKETNEKCLARMCLEELELND